MFLHIFTQIIWSVFRFCTKSKMVYPHTFRTEHSETRTTNSVYGDYYAARMVKHVSVTPKLLTILQYVDSNRNEILEYLGEAVKIKSISGVLRYRDNVISMIKFTEAWLKKLSIKYECFNIGWHELEGQKVRLPPTILASLGKDLHKKTVCVYTNLDVNRPNKEKWRTDPWAVTEIDRRLFGCGVASGKATLIMWFSLIEGFQKSGSELPVNLKFVIESMRNHESEGLQEFMALRKQDFFFNVNYVVLCDSEWIGEKYPCLTYASVGILHFQVTVEKEKKLDSDPKKDIIKIFDHLHGKQGEILIPNFNDVVQQITPDEEQLYEAIKDFDVDELRDSLPEYKRKWDKVKLLMHFWRLPSMLVDDIKECICEKPDTTKVKRNFIIKIVPRQIIETASEQTLKYIDDLCKELKISSKVDVELISASRPWIEDTRSTSYEAARRATLQVYKEDPNLIREDRDMKTVVMLSRTIEKNVLVLPIGDRNINVGGDNENMPKKNYFEGIKLLGAYLFQVADIDD